MRILVYEWACAGGYRESPGILVEGYAMMQAAVEDFSRIAEAAAALDPALAAKAPVSMQLAPASLKEAAEAYSPDYVLIIAPESAGVLKDLVSEAIDLGLTPLNCSPEAIELCGDKQRTIEEARGAGLATPKSIPVSTAEAPQRPPSFPAVAKPLDGVGCESLYLARDRLELLKALKLIRQAGWQTAVVQEYIRGANVSVSLIAQQGEAKAITVNSQFISLAPPPEASSYKGGYTPVRLPKASKAAEAAEKICARISGLRGYIGVDLVLAEEPYIIEVNPRLTTSYIGVRMVADQNIAEAMLPWRKLPLRPVGYSAFKKLKLRRKPRLRAHIAAPPGLREAMVAVWAPSLREALAELKRASTPS